MLGRVVAGGRAGQRRLLLDKGSLQSEQYSKDLTEGSGRFASAVIGGAVASDFEAVVEILSDVVTVGAAKAITLAGSDVDGTPLSYTIVTPPTTGTLSGTPPNVTYTPAVNYNGSASFTFKAGDGLYAAFECRTVDTLLVFGSNGRVYSVPVAALPGARGDGQPVTTDRKSVV